MSDLLTRLRALDAALAAGYTFDVRQEGAVTWIAVHTPRGARFTRVPALNAAVGLAMAAETALVHLELNSRKA